VRFEKWQSLGNDYVIMELDQLPWELTPDRVKRLCEPHFGIGSDGILLLSRPEVAGHVAELRIFNPDGTEAELSGNGARQAALYLRRAGWTGDDEFSILTKAGEVRPVITSPTTASVAMGRATLTSDSFPSGGPDGRGTLAAGGREWSFQHVWVGNPQCVIEAADEVEELDLGAVGPEIEGNDLFPNRTNVSFVKTNGSRVRARIFERGVGETLSSGTGASGAAVAAVVEGAKSPVAVQLDGGELTVEVEDDLAIRLTGAAHPLFAGEISRELVRELEEG
jgi:diaminopimelate epimerase